MKIEPLHSDFGVSVDGFDLASVSAARGYAELRDLFETHSLLLFRGQPLSDKRQLALAALFGPIEDRIGLPAPRVAPVSNVTDAGTLTAAGDRHTLHLRANQLWHVDSSFLPAPALVNILQARVVSPTGGETEFASTRAGWKRLPADMQERLRRTVIRHRYAHSRARIDPELAKDEMFTKWPDQCWRAVWANPETGEKALYIASHACAVEGMEAAEGQTLIDDLLDRMTPPSAVYRHDWQPGDVLIWDQRAVMHRGLPWPTDQPRTLVSVCVSARDCDGLDDLRPASN